MVSGKLPVERVDELHGPGHVGRDLQGPTRVENDAAVLVKNLIEIKKKINKNTFSEKEMFR